LCAGAINSERRTGVDAMAANLCSGAKSIESV
jgi:hypothetical protein